jgi:hypothetical protein
MSCLNRFRSIKKKNPAFIPLFGDILRVIFFTLKIQEIAEITAI